MKAMLAPQQTKWFCKKTPCVHISGLGKWGCRDCPPPSAPTAVEPDERAEFEAWVNTQPIKPFPMHMAAKAFAAGFAARASKGTP